MDESLKMNLLRLLVEARLNARWDYLDGKMGHAEGVDFMCEQVEKILRQHGVSMPPSMPRGVGDCGNMYRPFHFRVIGPIAMSVA